MPWGRLGIVVLLAAGCAAPSTAAVGSAPPRPPASPPSTKTTSVPASTLVPLTIAAPSHAGSYDRDADFGPFVDQHGCEDTRAVVLQHDSAAPVTYTTGSDCTVKTGRWTDPWSGVVTTTAHAFQIDHTVPLENAWVSGAWSWTRAQRVAYANDFTDADHLVPIVGAENESKGDAGPDRWRPPLRSAWCRYARAWDHIKAKWHLTATASEWTAITQMAVTCPLP